MAGIKIEINTDGAAFEENLRPEIIRILKGLCRTLSEQEPFPIALFDLNGNRVGDAVKTKD